MNQDKDTVDHFIARNTFYQQALARAKELAVQHPDCVAFAFYLTAECSAARAYCPDRAITAVACPPEKVAQASLLAARALPVTPPETGGGFAGRDHHDRIDDPLCCNGSGEPDDAS